MVANYKKAFALGDRCRTCNDIVTSENCVWSGNNLRVDCRKCWTIRAKEYNAKRDMKHHNMKHRYGMVPEEYNKKLELQLGGCAICKQPCKTGRNLAIDHSHKTNILRDLLCQRCNVVLGLVNDDELLLFDMMDYLKRHETEVAS
jgi:hypothetical protein